MADDPQAPQVDGGEGVGEVINVKRGPRVGDVGPLVASVTISVVFILALAGYIDDNYQRKAEPIKGVEVSSSSAITPLPPGDSSPAVIWNSAAGILTVDRNHMPNSTMLCLELSVGVKSDAECALMSEVSEWMTKRREEYEKARPRTTPRTSAESRSNSPHLRLRAAVHGS